MFNLILDSVTKLLLDSGISAMRSYPKTKLKSDREAVCVSLDKAKLLPSGMANYLGTGLISDEECELYGEKAELTLGIEIYAPLSGTGPQRCFELAEAIREAIETSKLRLRICDFSCGDADYNAESGMFRCHCTMSCIAYPLRGVEPLTGKFTDFVLRGEVK